MITIDSALGYFGGMLFALLLALGLSKIKPFSHTTKLTSARFGALDGLRGFLATAVVFTHMKFFRSFELTGIWDPRVSSTYSLLGPIAVTLFFMITGFLFWNKVLVAGGKIEAWSLYRGRVRRIVPAYSLLVAVVLILTFASTGCRLLVPKAALAHQLIAAASMGIRSLPSINDNLAGSWAGAVSWTLGYEWRFYIILPLIAGLAGLGIRGAWLFLAPIALFGFDPYYCMFALGILASYLVRIPALQRALNTKLASAAVIAVIMGRLLILTQVYTPLSYIMCFCVLLPIVCGNDLFGLLRLSASRHLGAISYSIYIFHCLLLYVVYRTLGLGHAIVSLPPLGYWLAMTGFLGGVVGLCTLTYHFVEWPFIRPKGAAASRPDMPATELVGAVDLPAVRSSLGSAGI